MTPPTLRAIKCSERMPTREDADLNDNVLYAFSVRDGSVHSLGHWCDLEFHTLSEYFFPLNRSAIATDAEEQRGEGGE